MSNSLQGALILVTRPVAQAEALCGLIEQRGGLALRFPALEIRPVVVERSALEQALAGDWLIFTSANAVDFALQAFDGKMPLSESLRLAAVGQTTADALQQAGLKVACVPCGEFSSEGLLAEAAMQQVSGQRIAIVRGVGGREKLAQSLGERGAEVVYLEVYRRCRPEIDNTPVLQALREGRLSACTVTSGEALENLLLMLPDSAGKALRGVPLIVVSDRIRQLAQQLDFETITVSRQATNAAIFETLTTLLNGENSGRSN